MSESKDLRKLMDAAVTQDLALINQRIKEAYELGLQVGALAMCHYYHGDYASEQWKNDHADRAMRPEHVKWAEENYDPPKEDET